MGLLSVLFGKKLTDEEKRKQAEDFILKLEKLEQKDPKAAMDFIKKESKNHRECMSAGAPFFGQLKHIYARVKSATSESFSAGDLPEIYHSYWKKVHYLKDLADTATRADDNTIIFMEPENDNGRSTPDRQLDGLSFFVENENIVMVTVGEETILFRKSFVLNAARKLNPETEEIGQDLEDFAKESGLLTAFTVG